MAAALGSFTAWLLSFFVLERIWTRVLEEVGKVVEVPDIENIKSYGEGKNFEIEKNICMIIYITSLCNFSGQLLMKTLYPFNPQKYQRLSWDLRQI